MKFISRIHFILIILLAVAACTNSSSKKENTPTSSPKSQLSMLSAEIAKNPTSAALLYNRSKLYHSLRQDSLALNDLFKAIRIDSLQSDYFSSVADIPALNPSKIKSRYDDFTDLCVMYCLYYYMLPKVADFSREDNAERAKIGFYQAKFEALFQEMITAGDWYDFDGSGTISSSEKQPGKYSLKRVR